MNTPNKPGKNWRILSLALLLASPGWGATNLLVNGDFERGKISPTGWQTVDGLTSFWATDPDPARGKMLRFETGVLQSQAYAWWKQILHGALPKDAPAKIPYRGEGYDTLAGLDGVWFYSDPVPVKPGQAYWLTVDAKGPEFLLWLMGYPEPPSQTFGADAAAFQGYLKGKGTEEKQERGQKMFLQAIDWKGQMKAGGAREWKTYSRRAKPFRPTEHTPNVRYVRVMLLPLWPPGLYEVDNVRLTEHTP